MNICSFCQPLSGTPAWRNRAGCWNKREVEGEMNVKLNKGP